MATPKEEMCISLENLLLLNHCMEFIDIWHGTSLGYGDSSLFK